MKKTILFLSVILLFTGCDVFKQIGGAYSLSQCEYSYNSMDNIKLAGMNFGNGSSISLADFASIATLMTGGGNLQTIPLAMTLKMNVKNPNQAEASLNALDYSIEINDLEFTTGKLNTPIRIAAEQTQILPINMSIDLKQLMNRYSKDKISGIINSLLGISSNKTTIKVNLWPKVMIGKTSIKSPTAIPVTFTFGGGK